MSDERPTQTGITLVLPSLKALKAAKAGNRSKTNVTADSTKKAPRPVKLKPLKDVLSKIIYQIKKKDDYAFFIRPVDVTQVPGYTDVIKHPMDFGTMTSKVERGKYRSLEDFASDFRLVTMNAKIFNPPGSIYHSEADRIEAWGLEHISKASAHVIEYETNWNIEIENDDDDTGGNVNVDDEDVSTPRDVEGSMPGASPAPSTTPAPGLGRRGPRGSRKAQAAATSTTISDSLDPEGRLPGSKEGIGAFPPGSPFAELMVALKIKGKRYKTKKERLRIEKEGPPYCMDGSLDYTEIEDPFSVLNVFVPDPPSRPQIYPTPPSRPSVSSTAPPLLTTTSTTVPSRSTRRHWTITRTQPTRSRLKDAEQEEDTGQPRAVVPRDAVPGDWGAFTVVLADSAAGSATGHEIESGDGSEHGGGEESNFWTNKAANQAGDYLVDVVYGGQQGHAYVRSIAEFMCRPREADSEKIKIDGQTPPSPTITVMPLGMPLAQYVETHIVDRVTRGRHSLLRDVFCAAYEAASSSPVHDPSPSKHGTETHIKSEPDADVVSSLIPQPHPHPCPSQAYRHRHPLSHEHSISPGLARILTLPSASSTLAVLRAPLDMAALLRSPEELARASTLESTFPGSPVSDAGTGDTSGKGSDGIGTSADMTSGKGTTVEKVCKSGDEEDVGGDVDTFPEMTTTTATTTTTADNGEGEGEGREMSHVLGEREAIERALLWSARALEELQSHLLVGGAGVGAVVHDAAAMAGVEVDHDAGVEVMGGRAVKIEDEERASAEDGIAMDVDVAPHAPDDMAEEEDQEDPFMKRVRLNLIALAKRAPLDKIARLPAALVPESIRGMVPTL